MNDGYGAEGGPLHDGVVMTRRLAAYITRHPVIAYRWHRAVTALWPIEMTAES